MLFRSARVRHQHSSARSVVLRLTSNHGARSSSERDRENDDQGGGNHGETSSDGVEDNLGVGLKLVGRKDDDREQDGDEEEEDREPRELAVEGSSDVRSEKRAKGIQGGHAGGGDVAVEGDGAVLVLAGHPCLATGGAQRFGNSSNLSLDRKSVV